MEKLFGKCRAAESFRPWVVIVATLVGGCGASRVPLTAGMRIDRSAVIEPRTYALPAPAGPDDAVIHITGQDLVVDFSNVTMEGALLEVAPDRFQGVAVRVENGQNITIKNLTARGYKVALLARNVENLRITGCDFSYNYRQRLRSTLEREDLSDWLSYHHNDNDEWLRYGAGIYLHDCDRAEVSGCTITGGQNGLLMTRCDDGLFWNNSFSFNSGVGIGMYRSNRNRVMHNRLDWNVRGYSHGVYHRGQDSAAILVYEQSCNNTFAYNSATHSGDGFFLWAGQTTMDTGQGGCNDNLIAVNDFSYAPTNGIEVTFSRNVIVNNEMRACDYGIWGGYSYDTVIQGNLFKGNRIAVAIEHGQNNRILVNEFRDDRTGIRLWQNDKQDPSWGYPKHRDTRSRDYDISENLFVDVSRPIELINTSNVKVEHNGFGATTQPIITQGNVSGLAESSNTKVGFAFDEVWAKHVHPRRLKPEFWPRLPKDHPRGREYILVDEWGPYDFKSPKLWPREKLADGRQRFEILGPPGTWRLVSQRGAESLSAESGKVPGFLTVGVAPGKVVDLDIRLEYVGAEVTTQFGRRVPAGQPYSFGFSKFVAPIEWTVKWFSYDDSTEPRSKHDAFQKMLRTQTPLKQETTTDLAYAWYGAIGKEPGMPADHFATLAEGVVDVPPGEYRIEVTSDDGVRVWLDDRPIIDNWTWHVPTTDTATVQLDGRHRLRVEHFEIDGFATLKLSVVPARDEARRH